MGEVVYFFEPEIAELARRIREAHARRQSTGRTG
jgi:hypothetical protein